MLLRTEWPEDGSQGGQREAVASGERYVDKLQEELGKRAPMFVDDANFIRCGVGPASSPNACRMALMPQSRL